MSAMRRLSGETVAQLSFAEPPPVTTPYPQGPLSAAGDTAEGIPEYRHGCRCGHEWDALSFGCCPACHKLFGSDSAFERHLTGTAGKPGRRCLTEVELRKKGYVTVERRANAPVWVRGLREDLR